MKKLIKPAALQTGDTVATISLSFGGAGLFKERYAQGKRQIEETFGVHVIETTHALCSPQELYDHPEWRLADLKEAFLNPKIKAIICNIGGDDSVRLLSLMTESDFDLIRNHPKILMGLSDPTVIHFMCYRAGLSSFYGPMTLFGLAENGGISEYTRQNIIKALFCSDPIGVLPENKEGFIVERLDWATDNKTLRQKEASTPWRYIGADKIVQGRLIGGCFDVLAELMNGTNLYPPTEDFEDTILFLETSEGRPSPESVSFWMRNLGAKGILKQIKGLLFARPGGEFSPDKTTEKEAYLNTYPLYDEVLLKGLKEYGAHIPVVTNMDFGHTCPHLVLPYGALTQINPTEKTVRILESGVL